MRSTSTRRIVDYAVAIDRRHPRARARRPAAGQAVHRVRRQPARLDQPRPCCPRAGRHPRPPVRHPGRRDRARARRPPPPRRAQLHGPRRGSHGRHDPRPDPARRRRAPSRDHRRAPGGAIGMTFATPDRPRSHAQPGPGPTPEALLRALDLTIARRIRGLLPGEFRAPRPGRRHRARAGPPVRAGRRRPAHRLERHRADHRPPRPGPCPGARADRPGCSSTRRRR